MSEEGQRKKFAKRERRGNGRQGIDEIGAGMQILAKRLLTLRVGSC